MFRHTKNRVALLTLGVIFVALLCCTAACSDDSSPPGGDGQPPTADYDIPRNDSPVSIDQSEPSVCTDGDKRCDGLDMVQVCQNGQWQDLDSCKDKKIGDQTCTCSITLMYVCSVGAAICR